MWFAVKLISVSCLVAVATCQRNTPDSHLRAPSDKLELPLTKTPVFFNSEGEKYVPDYFHIPAFQAASSAGSNSPSEVLQVPANIPYNPTNDPALHFTDDLEVFKTVKVPKKYNAEIDAVRQYENFDIRKNTELPIDPLPTAYTEEEWNRNQNEEITEIMPIVKALLNKPKNLEKKTYEQERFQKKADLFKKTHFPKSKQNAKDAFNQNYGIEQLPQETVVQNFNAPIHQSSGERLEFQVHGYEGPESYKFGFDTGKGHNRQFRYEERDHEGHVKGHYGYYDKTGKLRVVNYAADPHAGFTAHPEIKH